MTLSLCVPVCGYPAASIANRDFRGVRIPPSPLLFLWCGWKSGPERVGSGGAEAAGEFLHAVGLLATHRFEDEAGDAPRRLLLGDIGAVFLDAAIEELEGVARLVHLVEGIDDVLARDIGFEEIGETDGLGVWGAARRETRVADVVEHGAGPREALDEVLLVESCFLKEGGGLAEEFVAKFDRQEHLDAEAILLEELVVEQRPDDGAHTVRCAVDEGGFVDAIDDHDDAGDAERAQDRAEAVEHGVAGVVGIVGGEAGSAPERLGDERDGPREGAEGAAGRNDLAVNALREARSGPHAPEQAVDNRKKPCGDEQDETDLDGS